jgi:hypothetical protein
MTFSLFYGMLYTSSACPRDQLLQLSELLSPLRCNLLFGEFPCLALEHSYSLIMGELHLIAHRYQAACDVVVVLPQQVDGQHHVVDVVEHKRMLIRVLLLLRQESHWVVAPMAKRVEMVRSVVSIIVAVPVALLHVSECPEISRATLDIPARQSR